MVYFDQILHNYACENFKTTGMRNIFSFFFFFFWKIESFLGTSPTDRDQLVKILITHEPHAIVLFVHYANIPVQYRTESTVIFHGCKNGNFLIK